MRYGFMFCCEGCGPEFFGSFGEDNDKAFFIATETNTGFKTSLDKLLEEGIEELNLCESFGSDGYELVKEYLDGRIPVYIAKLLPSEAEKMEKIDLYKYSVVTINKNYTGKEFVKIQNDACCLYAYGTTSIDDGLKLIAKAQEEEGIENFALAHDFGKEGTMKAINQVDASGKIVAIESCGIED